LLADSRGSITALINGIYFFGNANNATETDAKATLNFNRITHYNNAIAFQHLHFDPDLSAGWNEIQMRPGCTVAINIYSCSGMPGYPILIRHNWVSGVVPAFPGAHGFVAAGIITDVRETNPALPTSNVEICYNKVVGCSFLGITLFVGPSTDRP
jgi:hypothetical protein